ncbi:MAG TPA: gamma carbonic anhydrase family protein [Atribacterota bacterium]|nr:gamma carbonic anhydrase family protein [Atribacterota bacterium]
MILKYNNKTPSIDDTSLVVENASIIGQVYIGKLSSIWFYSVLRGDLDFISIGHHTSVQDGVLIHVAKNVPTKIGNYVTIGHGAILHGCTVKDYSLIGSGANILDEAVIEENVIIAAGTVVTPKTVIPANSMVMGIPGKVVRQISKQEYDMLREHAEGYVKLMKNYKK